MSRYIDREDLLKNLKQFAPEHLTPLIVMLIEKQPTADVVEVVRCKDCKYLSKNKFYCKYFNIAIIDNGFCYRGARMDGET